MKLNMDIQEELMGSKAKIKVLRFLLLDGRALSERELATRMGVSHMAVNRAMEAFSQIGLVEPTMVGKSKVWSLNRSGYSYEVAEKLGGFFAKKQPILEVSEILRGELDPAKHPSVKAVYLFGSVAAGSEKPGSDIDLLVLAKKGKKNGLASILDKKSSEILDKFGNGLSPLVFEEGSREAGKWLKKAREGGKQIF